MLTSRWTRFLQVALLVALAFGGVGCFGLPGGGGGGITPTPTFITGTFTSEKGKSFIFTDDGGYQLYLDEEKKSANAPEIESKYEVLDKSIVFERANGTKFAEPATLSEDGNSFTWAEHPGETFKKQ